MHTLRISNPVLALGGVSYPPSLIAHVTNRHLRKRQENGHGRRLKGTGLHQPMQKMLRRRTKAVRPRVLHVQTRLENDTWAELSQFDNKMG